MDRIASLRTQALFYEISRGAAAPISHHSHLPSTAGFMGSSGDPAGWRVILRVDSVPASEHALLCDVLDGAHAGRVPVAVALSAALPDCVRRLEGGPPILRPTDHDLSREIAAELGGARWLILDAQALSVYSRWTVPVPEDLARTLLLFETGLETVERT